MPNTDPSSPPVATPRIDDHTLLCEACGYDLRMTDPLGPCPECGQAVAESSPDRRTGTPWQVAPGVGSWWRTGVATVLRPSRTFGDLRIEGRRATSLVIANCLIAGVLIADPFVGVAIWDPVRWVRGRGWLVEAGAFALSLSIWALAAAGILLLLTRVEYLGMRFIAARRGWRLTREAAWQVCCHASVGWIFAGLLPLLLLAVLFSLLVLFRIAPKGVIQSWPLGLSTSVNSVVIVGGMLGGYFLGLLAFEVLAYRGVRRCRFAATRRDATPGG